MGIFSFLFGNKDQKVKDFTSRGAVILDVRTKGEYEGGAIPGSKNIPIQQLQGRISEIKKWNKPVITCCASGVRSGSAKAMLKANGIEAMNGGGYIRLFGRLEKLD